MAISLPKTVLTPPLSLLWSTTLDSVPVPSPGMVAANNLVYVKSAAGTLYALNASTGAVVWSESTDSWGGLTVYDNVLYAANSCDNCTIQAFNATTGQELWESSSLLKGGIGLTVVDGVLYVGSDAHQIQALDSSTGNVLWTQPLSNGIPQVPTVLNDVIYVSTFGGTMYALDATDEGEVLWSHNHSGVIYSSPAYANGSLYIGTGTGHIKSINPANGNTNWQSPTVDSTWNTPVYANGIVYSQSLWGQVKAVNATNGSQIWHYLPESSMGWTSPVVVANDVVYFGLKDDKVRALDAQDGTPLWEYQTGGDVGSLIISNNTLFLNSSDGKVYAFNVDGQQGVSISVTPSSSSVSVGQPFTVDVNVNSSEEAFNAVRANVSVSSNLTVTAIQPASSNACNLSYTQTPTTSNPSFAGAILGGSSTGCTVYRLVLTPTESGTGTVTFSNASVKAYSDNSEIFDEVQNGTFTINTGVTPTPNPLLEFTIHNTILTTYNATVKLFGSKLENITNIFVNGSDDDTIYPLLSVWETPVDLSLGANTFTIYGSDGVNQTATQSITINRHMLGDINGDEVVDIIDLSLFAVDWDKTEGLTYNLSDMDGDGDVDLTDLSILAKLFTE